MSKLDYIYRSGKKLYYGYTKQFVWLKNESEFKELLDDPAERKKVFVDIEQDLKRRTAVVTEQALAKRKKREYIK